MAVKKSTQEQRRNVADVAAYMRELDHPCKKEMQAIRKIILGVDPRITEEIKWNAPSFALGGHFATFNAWATDYVQLILHHGAKKAGSNGKPVEDPHGLLEWLAADRASIKFESMKDIRAKEPALRKIIRSWIRAVSPGA